MTVETNSFRHWYNANANRLAGEDKLTVCHMYRKETKSDAKDAAIWSALCKLHGKVLVSKDKDVFRDFEEFALTHPRPELIAGLHYSKKYIASVHGTWSGREFTADLVYHGSKATQFANLVVAGFKPTNYTYNRSPK